MYTGGFSKSLINFLLCAQSHKEVSFDILFLDDEIMELEKDLPNNVDIIRVKNELYRVNFLNRLKLFYHKCKYVFFEKFYRIIYKSNIDAKYVTEYAQFKNLIRAKSLVYDFNFTRDYDSVISWQECYCNYVLSEVIPPNYKIGFIHPNYLEAHFNKNIDKISLKKLDKIVTISKSCFYTLCEVFPEFSEKIVYIPNRLNYLNLENKSNEYNPDIDNSFFNILTVARVVDHDKAVFRIVDLSEKLHKNGFNFKWYVIGNGSDFDEMKRRIAEKGLTERVVSLGENLNPCPYMANVDLFVMQSHREGRPVAVDEALLLGTPVLITEYSSAHEQVTEGETGWIVKDDFDSIYNKLSDILTNKAIIDEVKSKVNNINKHAYEDCSLLINTALGN